MINGLYLGAENRIHKRLPTLGEDYQLPENKMIEIAEGA